MLEYYKKGRGDFVEKVKTASPECWVKVVDPSEKEIDFLVETFKMDREEINDGLDVHETPRIDSEEDFVYIHSTVPTESISQDHDSSFLIAISKDKFFTISKHKLEVVESNLDKKKEVKQFSNAKNLFRVLFSISRLFEMSVGTISKEIKKNKLDLSKLKTRDIEKLIKYEDRLASYTSSFGATIHVYHRLLREKIIKFSDKDKEEIEDLIVDLNETLVLCNETSQSISNMRNYYNAKLSNDLNRTVLLLTIATIFLSIPTIFGSIYGMNIPLPYQQSEYFFYALGGLIVLIWVGMFFALRKFKLL